MTADADLVVLWVAVTLYATFGGADFGGGFWNLVAGRGRRGRRARDLIDLAIGPVWEANHVWLIFSLVVLWTAFSTGFAAITSTLFDPLMLAVLAIVVRGVGFAFRKSLDHVHLRGLAEALFAAASLAGPFFLGTVVGAVVAGQVPAGGDGAQVASWTGALPVLFGLTFVGTCAWLGAVFLTGEAASRDDDELRRYFSRRARVSGVVTGLVGLGDLVAIHDHAHRIFDRLIDGPGLALVILSGLAVAATFVLLGMAHRALVRPLAAAAVVLLLWGWGYAQYPDLLPGSLTVRAAAGPEASLVSVLVVFALVVVLVVPAFALLFVLESRGRLAESDGRDIDGSDHPELFASPDQGGTPPTAPTPARAYALAGAALAVGVLIGRLTDRRDGPR